ncbi:MAG TPA: sugar ABC transporter substrate-binding protein [Bradyrhizobium sp.]|nr:sugar ABC transporter substrate-binding protein [Bradyrhizobium sp.]
MSHPLTIAASCSGIARAFAVALVFVAGLAGSNIKASAVEMSPAAKAVVDYDKAFTTPTKKYRIAYLTECVDNPYCLARLEGLKAAAKKYGFDFKIFDANFSPATQAKVVENAVTEGFEGYLFGPAAAQPGCGLYNRLLKPTGKPVVSIDIAMCGDPDYTPGLAATLTMQGPYHFDNMLDNAFASCKGNCEVAAVGGFVGSDLFTYWENAIKKAAAKYPNVKVVVDEPANFDPRIALKKIQDALLAHPHINIVISSWDDMSRGVEQAVVAAGKTPGKDISIFSGGATKVGVEKVKSGKWASTMAYLPYQEAYYGAAALMMALDGKPINAYIDEELLPEIVNSTGTGFISKANADKYKPVY